MREYVPAGMSLHGSTGSRKYLNAAERQRFSEAAFRTPLEVQLFCIVLSLTGWPDFRNPRSRARSDRYRQRRCEHRHAETPQTRHRPAGPLTAQRDRQTRPRLSSSTASTRSRFSLPADLEMEPNNRVAASEGGHGGGRRKPYGGDAKRASTRLWGQRYREPRAAACDPAMARPCLTEDDSDLLRCLRPGRTCVCNSDVERIRPRTEHPLSLGRLLRRE